MPAFTGIESKLKLASGNKRRYINPKIEQELVEFKQEIEEKYCTSETNMTYVFLRPLKRE